MLLNSYEDCFNLIELYYNQILDNRDDESLIIKFEDIISNPEIEIRNMLNYCNLSFKQEDMINAIKNINPSRSYSYRNNSDLLEFENTFRGLIEKMGYSN
jgi:hypothetical protein